MNKSSQWNNLDQLIEMRGRYLEFLKGIQDHTLPGWQAYDVIDISAAMRTLRDLDGAIDFLQNGGF